MRDDFTKPTIETLAKRVGYRCSNPNCRQLTSGPRTVSDKAINVGEAAHITAAAPDGPRFDPTLSSEERRSIDNGIWLCSKCAKLIDSDTTRYTIDLLQRWKHLSEEAALLEIEARGVGGRDLILRQPARIDAVVELDVDRVVAPVIRRRFAAQPQPVPDSGHGVERHLDVVRRRGGRG